MATLTLAHFERQHTGSYIYSQNTTATGSGMFLYYNPAAPTQQYRSLWKPNYAAMPADMAIREIITTCVFSSSGNAFLNGATPEVEVYRILKDWNPANVTWAKYDGTNSWQTAGAKGATDAELIGSIYLPNAWATTSTHERVFFDFPLISEEVRKQYEGEESPYGIMLVPKVTATLSVNCSLVTSNTYDTYFSTPMRLHILHGDTSTDSPYCISAYGGYTGRKQDYTHSITPSVKDGDIILVAFSKTSNDAFTPPEGFTQLGTITENAFGYVDYYCYYKVWNTGDPLSFTWAGTSGTTWDISNFFQSLIIRQANPSEPFAATPWAAVNTSAQSGTIKYGITLAAVVVDNDNSLVVDFGYKGSPYSGGTVVYGYTTGAADAPVRTGGNNWIGVHSGENSSSGASGQCSFMEQVDAGTRSGRYARLIQDGSTSRWNAPVIGTQTTNYKADLSMTVVLNPTSTSIPLLVDGSVLPMFSEGDIELNPGYQLAVDGSLLNLAAETVTLNPGYQLEVEGSVLPLVSEGGIALLSKNLARLYGSVMQLRSEKVSLVQRHVLNVKGSVLNTRAQLAQLVFWTIPQPPVAEWWDEDSDAQWQDDDEVAADWQDDDDSNDEWEEG